MKIKASSIAMEANHSYSSSGLSLHAVKDMTRDEAASLKISDEGRSYLTLLSDKKDPDKRSREKQNESSLAKGLLEMTKKTGQTRTSVPVEEESPEIRALRYILEMMKRWAKGDYSTVSIDVPGGAASLKAIDMRSPANREMGTGRLMTKVTASYNVINESESTNFRTTGTALTEDGRAINFNVDFGMSRHFAAAFQSLEMEDYTAALCDPLIINVGADTTDISDRKFFFDLDNDGKEEGISGLNSGSGFLALDKNNDGKINNGSELFGTDSGDGFKDLTSYDSDGNGWIDENDTVYNRLKVWYNEGNGKEKLISLKDTGVGAIYLGNVETPFSDKNTNTGKLNGIIRRTGIFLRENGTTGTIQHVDLAL